MHQRCAEAEPAGPREGRGDADLLMAEVDPDGLFQELVTSNNTAATQFTLRVEGSRRVIDTG